jgi:branched-chain amino acid transport system ATP-binding protein
VSPLLDVQHVTKTYGGVVANRDVSLAVERGEIVGLIGPNGSGKTTLFSSIAGFHPIDAGSITFDGVEISRLRTPEVARLGLVRTFQQTLRVMFGRPRADTHEQAEVLLRFVGLHAKRFLRAGDLSFGQQKLLELGMALMCGPRMLLLDEPTAGINPTLVNGLVDRLKRANRELGVTLLVIEHNLRVIVDLASRLYCLAHGELLAEGTPASIQGDPRVVHAYLGAH